MRKFAFLLGLASCLPLIVPAIQAEDEQKLKTSPTSLNEAPAQKIPAPSQSTSEDSDNESDENDDDNVDNDSDSEDNDSDNDQETVKKDAPVEEKKSAVQQITVEVKSKDISEPTVLPSTPAPTPKAVEPKIITPPPAPVKKEIQPFTGRLTKNRVRVRVQPSFDGANIKELNQGQLVVVVGETDDFYAIKPLADMKAYVFRTYVLDNVIEGTKVNIRLKPDLEAPIIAQLNSGDKVDGHLYVGNNKWLEIAIPDSARLYIAKDYVEKAGDAQYMHKMEKRKDEVFRLLSTTKAVSDIEMQKPYDKIQLDGVIANYQRIILDYKDFPEAGEKAQNYLNALQNAYTNKKLSFLEQQSKQSSQLEIQNKELSNELNHLLN